MNQMEGAEPSPDLERLLRLTVSDIEALKQQAKLEFALKVGEVVVRRFFGGDFRKMRRRGPKDIAICRLAEHPDLPISASSLYVALQIYELVQRLGDLDAHRELSLNHYRAVLTAPLETQRQLLSQAVEGAWSAARLRKEVNQVLQPSRTQRFKPVELDSATLERRASSFLTSAASFASLDATAVAVSLESDLIDQLIAASKEVTQFLKRCVAERSLSHQRGSLPQNSPARSSPVALVKLVTPNPTPPARLPESPGATQRTSPQTSSVEALPTQAART